MVQDQEWHLLSRVPESFFAKQPDYDRWLLQLLYNRGIKKKEEIKEFLEADKIKGHDPFLLKDMERAVDLIIKHIKKGNKIFIYGDYDADGITSTALLYDLFSLFNCEPGVYMPDRIKEGYGLNKKAIDKIKKEGASLIITVDTGIRNKEEVAYAKEKGLDIIVTDHHIPPEKKKDLPDCLLIDPVMEREKYPYKELAGVGVAYKLATALISRSKLPEKQKEILEERLLDLVAIGTVADCVNLTGENRVLVKRGLKVLNHTKRLGLTELIKSSGLKGKIDSWNIGFQLAPRINASSRIDHAARAFYLLVSKDKNEASQRALDLNQKNVSRQQITEKVLTEAMEQVKEEKDKIIIALSPETDPWPEGVIGLVAGRLSNMYYCPALVITRSEGKLKGSGRSIEDFNVVEALEKSKELLDNYGGHPAACGFSLTRENRENFFQEISKYTNHKLKNLELKPRIYIDSELDWREIDEDLLEKQEKMAPFGEGNPKPIFLSRKGEIRDIVRMGRKGEHIKFRINNLWAVSFGKSERWSELKIGDKIDLVYYLEMNEFKGNRSLQLKVVDIKKASSC